MGEASPHVVRLPVAGESGGEDGPLPPGFTDAAHQDILGIPIFVVVTLVIVLIGLWHFAYLTVAIRRCYLTAGRWGRRLLLSVAAAMLIYVLNTAFMNAVQLAGAAIALALS